MFGFVCTSAVSMSSSLSLWVGESKRASWRCGRPERKVFNDRTFTLHDPRMRDQRKVEGSAPPIRFGYDTIKVYKFVDFMIGIKLENLNLLLL